MSDDYAPDRIIVQNGKVTRVFVPGIGWLFFEGQPPFDGGEYVPASRRLSPELVERLRERVRYYEGTTFSPDALVLRDILAEVQDE